MSAQLLLLGGALISFTSLVSHILLFQKKLVLNRQIIALGLLHIYSLVTLLWAKWPEQGLQMIIFPLFLYGVLVAMVSTFGGEREIRTSILYLIFMQALSVGISFLLLLIYHPEITEVFGALRKLGFDTQPNFYVLSVLVASPLLIHTYYHSSRDIGKHASLGLLFVGIGVLILSGSRLPFVGIMIFLAGVSIFDHETYAEWENSQKFSIGLFLAAVLMSIISLLANPDLMGRFIDQTVVELSYIINADYSKPGPLRSKIYLVAVSELFTNHTYLIGIGFGNFGKVFVESTGIKFLANPHNIVLKYLIETGIVGTILVIYVLLLPLRYGLLSIYEATKPKERSRNVAITWAYVMLLCYAAFQPILGRYEFYFLSALLFATHMRSNEA